MVLFITVFVAAYPGNLAAHVVGNPRLRRVTVCEYYQTIVFLFVGVVYGLLKGCAAASDDGDFLHRFFQGLDQSEAVVELDDIHLGEAIAECAVDYAIEIGQVFGSNGAAYVHRDQQSGIETAYGTHILKAAAAVGAHAGQFAA